jgi:glucuronate isomerase
MSMRSHHITLSEPLSRAVETQVKSGRFKDFSAALQAAAWAYFVGSGSALDDYGLPPEEVAKAAKRDLAAIKRERREGKLKPFDL